MCTDVHSNNENVAITSRPNRLMMSASVRASTEISCCTVCAMPRLAFLTTTSRGAGRAADGHEVAALGTR